MIHYARIADFIGQHERDGSADEPLPRARGPVTRARNLEAEGRKLTPGTEPRMARMIEVDEHRAKAEWLAGRLTDDAYAPRLAECAGARSYPLD